MNAAIYARTSTNEVAAGRQPEIPPSIRAFLDLLAEAVAQAVIEELRESKDRKQ